MLIHKVIMMIMIAREFILRLYINYNDMVIWEESQEDCSQTHKFKDEIGCDSTTCTYTLPQCLVALFL